MLPFKVLLSVALAATLVVAKPQISFGEEDEQPTAPASGTKSGDVPKAEVEGPAPSEEVISVRLGLLAGYLNVDPVPGAKPIIPGSKLEEFSNNPYVPQGGARGNCLCVPLGKCVRPPSYNSNIPPGSGIGGPSVGPGFPPGGPGIPPGGIPNIPPPNVNPIPPGGGIPPQNTDGAGLIDVRIVNRPPAGVQCQNNFQYCCIDNDLPPVIPPPNLVNPPARVGTCGRSRLIPTPDRILDPTQAQFGEFPWMTVILGPNNNYIGGGVLITSRHVLTAAHKVANFGNGVGLKVRLGEWDAKENLEVEKFIELGVARVKINPFFNRANLQNDVAILTLDQPAPPAPHVNTACMPKFAQSYVGRRCVVTGWGKDAFGPVGNFQYILKKVDVPVLDANDCEDRLRKTRLGPFFQLSRTSFVCAGGEPGKDACSGDGGSPLVCFGDDGAAEVVGLVAWGIGCAEARIPGVYVNVPSYSSWIESELV